MFSALDKKSDSISPGILIKIHQKSRARDKAYRITKVKYYKMKSNNRRASSILEFIFGLFLGFSNTITLWLKRMSLGEIANSYRFFGTPRDRIYLYRETEGANSNSRARRILIGFLMLYIVCYCEA